MHAAMQRICLKSNNHLSMKKLIAISIAALLGAGMSVAQNFSLPAPDKTGGKDVIETLWNRASGTEYSDKMLSEQDLSNLLFSAIGINRENGKLTSPTARNRQEIRVFVFTAHGVCEYLNAENSLKPLVEGDHRDLIAGRQAWVKTAPVILLLVADEAKFGNSDERSKVVMGVDAGIVSENINIFCAATGLVTRPRMSMDTPAIKSLLGLDHTQTPLINNPVGYAK